MDDHREQLGIRSVISNSISAQNFLNFAYGATKSPACAPEITHSSNYNESLANKSFNLVVILGKFEEARFEQSLSGFEPDDSFERKASDCSALASK